MILKVVRNTEIRCLRKKGAKVETITPAIKKLDSPTCSRPCYAARGIGFAAQQNSARRCK